MLPEPDTPRFSTRRTRSADGTLIAYYTTDGPHAHAPVLVLANGLAGHHRAWSAQLSYFADRCRIVTWDYRGLFGSAHPVTDGAEAYGIDRQLEDLAAVLAAEELDEVGLVGWSIGVQIALEAHRAMPDRVRCLVLVNGTAGHPFAGLLDRPLV
ncbi:MAG: alpha/beta fold hydrolase, partial [Deltaproteobacteria bacterium]|nr:alpha/beta fold hydrolase [Deltaproteobacteria bacterium]MBW2536952.1 alpha/beta fold hydrolase [Deltaproteobacteria bacterium]